MKITDLDFKFTYQAAARICGLSPEAIRKRAARSSIRKSYAPDGTPVVILSNQEIDQIQKAQGLGRQPIVPPADDGRF
jgi:hypothetical protein